MDGECQCSQFHSLRHAIWEEWKQLQPICDFGLDCVSRSTTRRTDGNDQDAEMVVWNKLRGCEFSKGKSTKPKCEKLLLRSCRLKHHVLEVCASYFVYESTSLQANFSFVFSFVVFLMPFENLKHHCSYKTGNRFSYRQFTKKNQVSLNFQIIQRI